MNETFARDDVDALLGALDAELLRQGARADLFLVGGAATAVACDSQRSTRDRDAVFEPTTVVREAVATVGRARNLPDDWLNDAVASCPGLTPRRAGTSRARRSTSTSRRRATCWR